MMDEAHHSDIQGPHTAARPWASVPRNNNSNSNNNMTKTITEYY